LYFCDREGLRVMRCNLDGSEHETIVQTGDWQSEPEKVKDQTNWPVGITVSHKLNKLFWTQKGGSKASVGRILAASLDLPKGSTASNRQDIEVIQENLPECIDLDMDDQAGVLYWTDRGELPLGNTLNKKQIIGTAPEAEKRLGGRQIVSTRATSLPDDLHLLTLDTDRARIGRRHRTTSRQSEQLHLRRRHGWSTLEMRSERRVKGEVV